MKILVVYVIFLIRSTLQNRLNGEGKMCGRPLGSAFKLDIEERVIAGYDVGYYRYPWYVAFSIGEVISCGGALIGDKIVLTAAHCFSHQKEGKAVQGAYNVTLGLYNKCEKESSRKDFTIDNIVIHENYQKFNPFYDLAVVFLKEDTSAYQPICISNSVIKKRPREGTVPGLGTIKYHGPSPCTLHEVRLLIYSDDVCKDMLNRTGNDPAKLVSAFCAGYLQGGVDTCQGDSGGPFQIMDEYGNYVLLGVVSFGFRCANPTYLGVYTDVSQYLDWIEKTAKKKLRSHITNVVTLPNNTTNNNNSSIISNHNISTNGGHNHHFPLILYNPYFRPIAVIVLRNNKMVRVYKKVLHIPLH